VTFTAFHPSASSVRTILHAALAAALCAGCGLVDTRNGSKHTGGPEFPHAKHVEDNGCPDCHTTATTSAAAGMPTKELCMDCHEIVDEDLAPGHKAEGFFVHEQPGWHRRARIGGDVIFAHKRHLAAKIACTDCHGDIGATNAVPASVRLDMDTCLDCHTKRGASLDCATCHQTIRRDRKPSSHTVTWTRRHGAIAQRGDTDEPLYRCALCHSASSCDSCHLREPPADHSALWRRRAHGTFAAVDRERCATCHRADTCIECHNTARPQSHVAGWGKPMFLHCADGCHVGPGGSGCVTCHRSMPAHAEAPSLAGNWAPPPHPIPSGGLRCTTCHDL